jgi:hypothetical protein
MPASDGRFVFDGRDTSKLTPELREAVQQRMKELKAFQDMQPKNDTANSACTESNDD